MENAWKSHWELLRMLHTRQLADFLVNFNNKWIKFSFWLIAQFNSNFSIDSLCIPLILIFRILLIKSSAQVFNLHWRWKIDALTNNFIGRLRKRREQTKKMKMPCKSNDYRNVFHIPFFFSLYDFFLFEWRPLNCQRVAANGNAYEREGRRYLKRDGSFFLLKVRCVKISKPE